MKYSELRAALPISNGQAIVAPDSLTANLADFWSGCYAGQPIVITQATPGPDDDRNETVVICGKSSFLQMADLPVELRATVDAGGNAQLVLKYTLLGATPGPDDWTFSRSFPNLPPVTDWTKTYANPTSIPLDDLYLCNASYVVVSQPQTDPDWQVALQTGINFVSRLLPTGIVGCIESVFGHSGPLTLSGTIRVPAPTETTLPLPAGQYPWDLAQPPPGILLQADLGLGLTVGGMTLGGVRFCLYSPLTEQWQQRNPTFRPVLAYGGQLRIPGAGIEVDAVAPVQIGGNEIMLIGQFEGVTLGKLANLVDLSGTGDLINQMPDQIQALGDALGQLQLTHAAIDLCASATTGFTVGMTSFTIGMPDLKWQVWDGHFEIDQIACRFDVLNPFSQPQFEVSLTGSLVIEGVPVNIYASNGDGFTVYAELAAKQTLPLRQLMQTYVPQVPPPGDLTINALSLGVAPFKSYAMAMAMAAEPTPWVVDVGFESLTISDVVLAFTYPQGGPVAGSFGGNVAFGELVTLDVRYDIPGNFVIRGRFPTVRLSDLLSKLCNQTIALPAGFDLTFTNSSVLIQKTGANCVFLFGTTLAGYGVFALEVRKTSGTQWGFAAGIDLSSGVASSLPGLGPLQAFEELFDLQKLLLVIASFEDVGFTFPDLAEFNNPQIAGGRLALPGQGGVIAGLNLYADWVINTGDKQQNLLKEILGLDPSIGITLQVGADPSQEARLYVSYDTTIEGMPLSCKFGGQISGGSIALFLEGTMSVQIQGQQQTFDVQLDFVENGAFIAATMKGSTPINFEVFKLGNLALVIGCDWEGIPSLGVAGTIAVADFESSIAVFFDSAQPQKSMVAGALSNLSLKDVLDTLTGDVIPSDIDQVLGQVAITGTQRFTIPGSIAHDLDQLQISNVANAFAQQGVNIPSSLDQVFLVVDEPGSCWFLTDQKNDMRHYQLRKQGEQIEVSLEAQFCCVPQLTQIGTLPPFEPDFYVSGGIDLLGFHAAATINISPNQGIAVDAEMDRIVIGTEALFSLKAAEGTGGPCLSAATFTQPNETNEKFRPPHFYINGEFEILGLTREVYVSLTTSGLEFDVNGQMTPLLFIDVHGCINGVTQLGFGGDVKVGLGTIDLGPLGKIDVNTDVEGKLDIQVNGATIVAKLAAGFQFAGKGFDLAVDLDIHTAALLDLPETLLNLLKQQLEDFLNDAAKWAECVAKGLIKGVEDMEQVLRDVFHKTAAEAKAIADQAWQTAKGACAVTTAALHL